MPNDTGSGSPQFKIKTIGIESTELHDFQVATFANYVQLWRYGQDVYVDMALLTVEQMNELKPGGELTIAVHDRFVMSPLTFNDFANRVNIVREQLKAEGLIRDAPSPAETPK